MKISFVTKSPDQTKQLAKQIGRRLQTGEVFEFSSDLGGGKTTFIKGLVAGFGSADDVSSPTFTVSFTYTRSDGKAFHHFDFYRLSDPGIVKNELEEVIVDASDVVAIEWGEVVADVLPQGRISVRLRVIGEDEREVRLTVPDEKKYLVEGVQL